MRSDRLVLAAVPLILIATVLSVMQGGLAGLVVLALTLAASYAVAQRVASGGDLRFVVAVALGSLLLRDVAAGILDAYLALTHPYRALFHDDGAYVLYARQMALFWTGGDIGFPTDPSTRNSYAMGLGVLFAVIGENVMVVRLLNAFMLTLAGLLTYRTMRNLDLGGARWGLLGVVMFPSLALWSILALKDTYVLLWMIVAVWAGSEFIRSGRFLWFVPTVLALFVLDGARRYIFLVFVVAWPLGLALALSGRRRLLGGGLAAICSVGLLLGSRALETYTPETIGALSSLRAAMAQGARSALVDPTPVMRGSAGDRYLVTVSDDMPICTGEGRQVEVPLGSSVVVRLPGSTMTVPDKSAVYVAPCDVIVLVDPPVAAGGTARPATPTPLARPSAQPVVLVPEARNIVAPPAGPQEQAGLQRGLIESVVYLPTGVLFFLTAPFPLLARSAGEIAAIPEMLLWYASVALGLYGLYVLIRRRNMGYATGALALCGIALVLSLAEGNAGTLVRHRAMAIVFVVVLAAVGLDTFIARASRPGR